MKEKFEAELICTYPAHKFKKEGEIFAKHLREEKGVKVGEAKIRSQNMDINKCIGCRFFEIRTIIDGEELQGKIQPSGNNEILILENKKGKTSARFSIRE
jgi:hypothetical protein